MRKKTQKILLAILVFLFLASLTFVTQGQSTFTIKTETKDKTFSEKTDIIFSVIGSITAPPPEVKFLLEKGVQPSSGSVKEWKSGSKIGKNKITINAELLGLENNKDYTLYIIIGEGIDQVDYAYLRIRRDAAEEGKYEIVCKLQGDKQEELKIEYKVPEKKKIKIGIYNSLMNQLEQVLDEEKEKGNYTITKNVSDLSSGVYFCQLSVEGKTKKTVSFTKTFGGVPIEPPPPPPPPKTEINIKFPCPSGEFGVGECPEITTDSIPNYIVRLYQFSIGIAGILAVGMIIAGAIMYSVSGAVDKKAEGKDMIMSALWGVLLLFGSYLILKTINPRLIDLKEPEAPEVKLDYRTGSEWGWDEAKRKSCCFAASVASTCTEWGYDQSMKKSCCIAFTGTCEPTEEESKACPPPLTPLTDPLAIRMEGGEKIIWTSSNSGVQQNLTKLKNEFEKMKSELNKEGKDAKVTSVYRPFEYQKHFWEVFSRYNRLINNTNPDCAALKQKIVTEKTKHALKDLVAYPNNCTGAPHIRGFGIDIVLTNISYSKINKFLTDKKIDLVWQAIKGDEVHFNLKNPPYNGCG